MSTIFWFRQDLRIEDNPALLAATQNHTQVIPIYILDPDLFLGAAQKWWLHYSLESLMETLHNRYKVRLHLFRGRPEDILRHLFKETKAQTCYWSTVYDPSVWARDKRLKAHFNGVTHNSSLFFDPGTLLNKQGSFFKVFTPFANECRHRLPPALSAGAPSTLGPSRLLSSEKLEEWKLLPHHPNWAQLFPKHWVPGAQGAQKALKLFIKNLAHYHTQRDIPSAKTSHLSPYLHFGEIGLETIRSHLEHAEAPKKDKDKFFSELLWREFSTHFFYHFPELPRQNFNKAFDRFSWKNNKHLFKAWSTGNTGYPLVDAGMRELWHTGWMHNRVRMVVASFLVKDLLIDWRRGVTWFDDTLLDADRASNSFNWQWVAGSGADAAPYFRIFNPVTQSQTYDPKGTYIRTWVPELAKLPDKYIHAPWKAPEAMLKEAGITLGTTYPHPIVDHDKARALALGVYKDL